MNTIGILQPSYIPWLGVFDQIQRSDTFVFYDDVQFDKNGWRNRNRIKTANGIQWLTVPVLHTGFPTLLDVEINDTTSWRDKHIKTLKQNYAKAPFFKKYSADLLSIISDMKYKRLVSLSMDILVWLLHVLGIKTPFVLSSELGIFGDKITRLIDIIKHFGGDTFVEGSMGKRYINEADFSSAGVSVVYQDYKHPVYPQLYGEFVSHLSILDLLFNCGLESLSILVNKKDSK